MPRICVSISDRRPLEGMTLAELRLDLIPGDPPPIPGGIDVIATCRPAWEGGGFEGSEAERQARLEAGARGAWAVDIEARAEWRPGKVEGRKLILSYHDFEGTPRDLRTIVGRMLDERPDYVKVAATPADAHDLDLLARLQRDLGPRGVVVPMGELGAPARVLLARAGAPWTYAVPEGGAATAPGQHAERWLRETARFDRLNPSTRAFCVAGDPVAHSRSPELFNALFRLAGLDAVYLHARIPEGQLYPALEALGIEGASITIPHKAAAFEDCRVDAHAQRAGAVNTVARRGGAWEGTNTDARGFLLALEEGLGRRVKGLRILVLGAGGAARGILSALAPGNEVVVAGRNAGRAAELARYFGVRSAPWADLASVACDVLVNATPVGMAPDVESVPMDPSLLRPGTAVFDLVYTPADTRLLREARSRGCQAISGTGMFLAQAALQAEFWFGPDVRAAMKRAVQEFKTA